MKPIQRKLFAGMMVLAGVVSLSIGGYYAWLLTPPPMPTTLKQAADLLVSPRYMRLPENRRLDYMAKAAQLYDSATPQERKAVVDQAKQSPLFKEAARQAMEDRVIMAVRDYAKADDFGRRAMVDKIIGFQQLFAMRQANRQRSSQSSQNGETRPSHPPMTDAQRKEHQDRFMNWVEKELQTGNPQHQAYIGELVEAVINRRKEMGLDPLPFDPNRGR